MLLADEILSLLNLDGTMPRKIVDPGSIDEDLLRDLVGGVPRPDAVPIPSVPLEPADVSSMKTAEAADTSPEVRRRKVTLPDYESTFLKSKTVRHRMTVSISENTKRNCRRSCNTSERPTCRFPGWSKISCRIISIFTGTKSTGFTVTGRTVKSL